MKVTYTISVNVPNEWEAVWDKERAESYAEVLKEMIEDDGIARENVTALVTITEK